MDYNRNITNLIKKIQSTPGKQLSATVMRVLFMTLANIAVVSFLLFTIVWILIYVVGKGNTADAGWSLLGALIYHILFTLVLAYERKFIYSYSTLKSIPYIISVQAICIGIATMFLDNQLAILFWSYLLPLTILNVTIKPRNYIISVYVLQIVLLFGIIGLFGLVQ